MFNRKGEGGNLGLRKRGGIGRGNPTLWPPKAAEKNQQCLNAVNFVKPKNDALWEDIHSPTPKSNRSQPIEKIIKKGISVEHPTNKIK